MHLHVHLIPRYIGDVPNPRGGVRGIIPEKQNYQNNYTFRIKHRTYMYGFLFNKTIITFSYGNMKNMHFTMKYKRNIISYERK